MSVSESGGGGGVTTPVNRPIPNFSPRRTTRSSPRAGGNLNGIVSATRPSPRPLLIAQTPGFSPPQHLVTLSPTTRQTTRALQEIQSQIGYLTPNGDRGGFGGHNTFGKHIYMKFIL